MTRLQLVLRSLVYHRRIHLAVALGVAAATAVLTGALLVGDSVRGSLRGLTRERLGKIETILAMDRFFRQELVTELSATKEFQSHYRQALPAILFPQATIESRHNDQTSRASSVMVLGCEDSFWTLDLTGIRPSRSPSKGEIVLNDALSAELRAQVGDEVTLRLPKSNQVPADSPLANKNDRILGLPNLKVIGIVPAKGLGRFSLQAAQSLPLNAFVSLETLQSALEQPAKVNAIFVGDAVSSPGPDSRELSALLRPSLADFGVSVKQVVQKYQAPNGPVTTSFEYFTITTDRMIFDGKSTDVIEQAVAPFGGQPVLTYLANGLELSADRAAPSQPQPGEAARAAGDVPRSNAATTVVPYSMVTAIDFTERFRLTGQDGAPIGPLADDEIVLNSWTAENLQVQPGDRIRMSYFEPETTHGEAIERAAEFKVKGIAPLTKPSRPYERSRPAVFDQPPTAANDPDLTPEVKGVTDQDTIEDWDAPFPFDYKRMRKVDDKYWEYYRTTPKAFISAAAGRKLWGSRFGAVTSFRVPAGGTTLEQLQTTLAGALAAHAQQIGFDFLPIKQRQLDASRGTTPFDVLFLSLSMFVIASALLMVALLFRLGIEQRATEIGTLLAVGYTRKSLGRLFVEEGLLISAAGAFAGVVIGMGYARLILAGLSTWWLGAISAPFLEFHWTTRSLLLGYGLGVAVAVATIAWAVRQTRRITVRRLLSGQAVDGNFAVAADAGSTEGRGWLGRAWHLIFDRMPLVVPIGVAILLSGVATRLGGMAQAGAFVGSGAILLMVLLLFVRRRLRREARDTRPAWTKPALMLSLAERSSARNPGRSLITVGLMGTATFLIVAMSSFRLAPTEHGVGGFRFVAQSAEPVYADLNKPATRDEFFGSSARDLKDATILGMRLLPGDDASCQNLYQSSQPRVLGVSQQVVEHFDAQGAVAFTWGVSAAKLPADRANPWRLLAAPPVAENTPVPVVLDKNTALYSLHLYRGIGEEFEFQYDGQPIRFQVVGLLENSVLQGSLLIGEADFQQRFPSISGYRYFLIGTPADKATAVATALEDRFGDQGLDVTPARDVLEQLLAVQNTYLSTFQSLGALGLLLGAFGLATVQLRNVLERRGELALLRAVGYRRRRLAQLVLLENVLLLTAGLNVGVVAALLAVLPHKVFGESAISWLLLRDLALMLGAVFLAGLVSSVLTVRAVLRLPLLAALRGE